MHLSGAPLVTFIKSHLVFGFFPLLFPGVELIYVMVIFIVIAILALGGIALSLFIRYSMQILIGSSWFFDFLITFIYFK